MALPTLTGTARLTGDPDLRFAPNGTAVCKIHLAFNSRKLNKQTNEWEDGDSYFVGATAFKDLAEHIAESTSKGTEVHVTGRLKTREWQTDTGEKRSAPELLIDEIGPSLRYATAKVAKAERGGGNGTRAQSSRSAQSVPPADDPWASKPGYDDQPPF